MFQGFFPRMNRPLFVVVLLFMNLPGVPGVSCDRKMARSHSFDDVEGQLFAVSPDMDPNMKGYNTAALDWDSKSRTYQLSLRQGYRGIMHDTSVAPLRMLNMTDRPMGRLGNLFKQCMKAVFEGIMRNAVVRCGPISRKEWNTFGIEFVDPRSVRKGIRATGIHSLPSRDCRYEVFSRSASAHGCSMAPHAALYESMKPFLGRIVLTYLGTFGSSMAVGRKCNGTNSTRALAGHVRAEDLFNASEFRHVTSGGTVQRVRDYRANKGQPPLKFYTQAIRHRKFERVDIFGQDYLNPVVGALEELARQEPQLQMEVKVTAPMVDVLNTLLCARNVVMSSSTMAYAITSSWNLHKLIIPVDCNEMPAYIVAPTCSVWVLPSFGYSVFEEGWLGTAAQFAEMVSEDLDVPHKPRQCKMPRCPQFRHRGRRQKKRSSAGARRLLGRKNSFFARPPWRSETRSGRDERNRSKEGWVESRRRRDGGDDVQRSREGQWKRGRQRGAEREARGGEEAAAAAAAEEEEEEEEEEEGQWRRQEVKHKCQCNVCKQRPGHNPRHVHAEAK